MNTPTPEMIEAGMNAVWTADKAEMLTRIYTAMRAADTSDDGLREALEWIVGNSDLTSEINLRARRALYHAALAQQEPTT